jgi:hypothetical protein
MSLYYPGELSQQFLGILLLRNVFHFPFTPDFLGCHEKVKIIV